MVGVDHLPQKNYPFDFCQADAFAYLTEHGHKFAVIHASPPCQAYSRMARMGKIAAPKLIPVLRALLNRTGKPWVMENVEGAELEAPALTLCGTMFDLKVRRHRVFEVRPPVVFLTPDCRCLLGVVKGELVGHRTGGKVRPGRTKPPPATEAQRREAIGVPWMSCREARQAVPPAYTEFIGKQLLRAMEV